jgi:putative ABC transport system permease protein
MVVLLPELQKFMGRPGLVTGFAVLTDRPHDEADVQRICGAIAALAPGLSAKPAAESVRSTTEIKFLQAMAWITSAIAIIIGIVVMLNTMVMSVSERTREIGILRAIGWKRRRIVRMVLIEAFLLSLCGGVIGTIGAVALTRALGHHPAVAGLVDTHISGGVIAFGVVCALCVGVLGAAYPAYRGAQLLPTEALRHE